jgi:CRP-like cAMP-binding protein
MSGSVSIVRQGAIFSTVEEGAFLGETAMIGGVGYSLTARARDPVTAARIDQALFLRVTREYPDFGQAVMDALNARLGDTLRDFSRIRQQLTNSRPFSEL